MFHRFFTTQQLSRYFRIATAVSITCLLSLLLQHHYAPHAAIFEKTIGIFSHISFFITALIVISQMLLTFTKNHKKLIAQHKLVAVTIELFLTALVLWLLEITHHMKHNFVIFYSDESVTPNHSVKITFLLIFIVIMLIVDLYNLIKKDDEKMNDASIKKIISQEVRMFVRQYLFICASLIGLLHFNRLNKLAASATDEIKSSLLFYSDIFGHVIIILWIAALAYYLYNFYRQRKI